MMKEGGCAVQQPAKTDRNQTNRLYDNRHTDHLEPPPQNIRNLRRKPSERGEGRSNTARCTIDRRQAVVVSLH